MNINDKKRAIILFIKDALSETKLGISVIITLLLIYYISIYVIPLFNPSLMKNPPSFNLIMVFLYGGAFGWFFMQSYVHNSSGGTRVNGRTSSGETFTADIYVPGTMTYRSNNEIEANFIYGWFLGLMVTIYYLIYHVIVSINPKIDIFLNTDYKNLNRIINPIIVIIFLVILFGLPKLISNYIQRNGLRKKFYTVFLSIFIACCIINFNNIVGWLFKS